MEVNEKFDILIVVTPADCERLLPLYPKLVECFDNGKLNFIGTDKVGELVKNSSIASSSGWVDENAIVPFDEVHACMAKRLEPILQGQPLPRGVTGWYYQQFLKMQYSSICDNEYYMSWDGDTIPCRRIRMFSEDTRQPYLDLKHEYHAEYFDTMGKILPGFHKVIERSFISEHMLFNCDIMRRLISDIESNEAIEGTRFWEKIINAIEPEKIYDSSFSEFETYGTYVALRYPDVYRLREWHSFRLGGSFYDIDTITERDFAWLGVDFDAISFEKGQTVLDENRGYFDNPEVQQKISARKLLQAAQMEYKDAYKEVWEDDLEAAEANVRTGGYWKNKDESSDAVNDVAAVREGSEQGHVPDAAGTEEAVTISDSLLSQIPYTRNDEFNLLHYSCGRGAELRALRALYPNGRFYGIEPDHQLFLAAKKSEKVFESIDEVVDYFDEPFVNVLLVSRKCWDGLSAEEREILNALMAPEAVTAFME
jgi:hypothetical protein